MLSLREPLAEPPARGTTERAWFYVRLALFVLFCSFAVRESTSARSAGETSMVVQRTPASARSTGTPQTRGDDHMRQSAKEFRGSTTETEDEDATSDSDFAAAPLVPACPTAEVAFERSRPADTSQLLVSTGLGRGPPIG